MKNKNNLVFGAGYLGNRISEALGYELVSRKEVELTEQELNILKNT